MSLNDPTTLTCSAWALLTATSFAWVFAFGKCRHTRLPEVGGSAQAKKDLALRESPMFALVYPIVRAIAHVVAAFRPMDENDRMAQQLTSAGEPGGLCPQEFLAFGVFSAVLMPIAGYLALMFYMEDFGLLSVLAFAAFGAVYPLLWLTERVRWRRGKIVRALPYVLDNLTMSMEAGLDFGGAVERILESAKKKKAPIEEELHLVLQEVRMGKTQAEALAAFAQRVDSPDIKSFVGSVIQGEKLGTPLGQILRVQAKALRSKRFQRAEKLAGEAPVKILFPLLFVMAAVILTVFGGTIVRALKGELL